jgi:hypothetical protein
MTETVSRSASADRWNEPTKNLPPLEVSLARCHRWRESWQGSHAERAASLSF